MRASEERFRVVARATNDAIWEIDLITGEVIRGDTFAALFGYRPEEVGRTRRGGAIASTPRTAPASTRGTRPGRNRARDTYADEYRFRRADGTWAHVFDRAVLMRDADGVPVRVIGAMMDISERRQMEAKLALADRLASLGTLAAGVAHEINNPLSYVINNVRLVEERLRAARRGRPGRRSGGAPPGAHRGGRGARRGPRGRRARPPHRLRAEDVRPRRGGSAAASSTCAASSRPRSTSPSTTCGAARGWSGKSRTCRPVLANEARLGQVFLTLVVNAAESIPPGAADTNTVRVIARPRRGRSRRRSR